MVGPCLCQIAWRLIQRLIRQLKRAPVHGQGPLTAQVLKDLHRLLGVHMLVLHEPARLICADGQQREVEPTALFWRLRTREVLADVDEVFRVSRVACKEQMAVG